MRRMLRIAALLLLLARALADATMLRSAVNTNTSVPSPDPIQAVAASVLERMQDRLTTAFSQRDRVIETGFPLVWQPCVMRRILERKRTRQSTNSNSTTTNTTTTAPTLFNVLVLGGSSAARPGNGCSQNLTTDPFGGRYSNLLQKHLQHDWDNNGAVPIEWRVANMAQGAEVSAQGALFLDHTIDKERTDAIVWDYSINDSSLQGGSQEEVRKLGFWLTRLRRYYDNTPPPPIVLTYLWPHRAGVRLSKGVIDSLDKRPLAYLGDLLDTYRSLGWEIALVNIGAAVNIPALQQNYRLLFDDSAHPGCGGTKFLADVLEYALLHNLAQDCPSYLLGQRGGDGQLPSLPTPPETPWPALTSTLPNLWVDLFDPRAVIASASPWLPRAENGHSWAVRDYFYPTTGNASSSSSWPLEILPMHTEASREDKKLGFRLTRCSEHQPLTITLHQPSLKWLGLALRLSANTRLEINRQPVQLPDFRVQKWDYGQQLLTHWIPIMQQYSSNTNTTELSLCHTRTYTQQQILEEAPSQELPNLQYLIGVSLPPSGAD